MPDQFGPGVEAGVERRSLGDHEPLGSNHLDHQELRSLPALRFVHLGLQLQLRPSRGEVGHRVVHARGRGEPLLERTLAGASQVGESSLQALVGRARRPRVPEEVEAAFRYPGSAKLIFQTFSYVFMKKNVKLNVQICRNYKIVKQ